MGKTWWAAAWIIAGLLFVGLVHPRSPSYPPSDPSLQPTSSPLLGSAAAASPKSVVVAQAVVGVGKPTGPNIAAARGDFTTELWRTEGLKAVADPVTTPDGKNKAFRLTETSVDGRHRIETTLSGTAPDTVSTLSLDVKPAERHYLQFEMRDRDTGKYGVVRFDLGHNAVVVQQGDVATAGVEQLSDGWLRCWAAMPYTTAAAVVNFALMDDRGATEYPGRAGSGLLAGGVRFESGTPGQGGAH